jgi:hypothetical protein
MKNSVNVINNEREGDDKRESHDCGFWNNTEVKCFQQILCETFYD